MKVVFVQDVPEVGQVGDVKDVKNGHARNYLFPQGLAVLATPDELRKIEGRKIAAAKVRQQALLEAKGSAEGLEAVSLLFTKRVGSKGNMYGSVSNIAIAQELKALGHPVEKSMVKLDEPIRQLGEHEVQVELAKDVIATIKVKIEAAEGEGADAAPEEAEAEPEVVAETKEETTDEEPAVEE